MKHPFIIATALAFSFPAFAQNTVQQAGPVTPGHTTVFVQNGVVMDGGPASGGNSGVGASEILSVARGNGTGPFSNAGTGPYGTNVCDYDGPITSPNGYHYLCFSANAQGGGVLAYGAGGGAAQLPLQFIINGVSYDPTSGGGGGTTNTGIVITNGSSYTATANVETYAWKSASTLTKTLTLYGCNSSTAWNKVVVVDEYGSANLYSIFVAPALSNTIARSSSSYPISFSFQSQAFQCDGISNWMPL